MLPSAAPTQIGYWLALFKPRSWAYFLVRGRTKFAACTLLRNTDHSANSSPRPTLTPIFAGRARGNCPGNRRHLTDDGANLFDCLRGTAVVYRTRGEQIRRREQNGSKGSMQLDWSCQWQQPCVLEVRL